MKKWVVLYIELFTWSDFFLYASDSNFLSYCWFVYQITHSLHLLCNIFIIMPDVNWSSRTNISIVICPSTHLLQSWKYKLQIFQWSLRILLSLDFEFHMWQLFPMLIELESLNNILFYFELLLFYIVSVSVSFICICIWICKCVCTFICICNL